VKKSKPPVVRHRARHRPPKPIAQASRTSHDETFQLLPSPPSGEDETALLLAVLALGVLVTSSMSLLQLARRAGHVR
jgi:hypothetical protein